MYENGPIHTNELYELAIRDPYVLKNEFFRSRNELKKNYFKRLYKNKIFVKESYNLEEEKYPGYTLNNHMGFYMVFLYYFNRSYLLTKGVSVIKAEC